jgi:hypothetical protein
MFVSFQVLSPTEKNFIIPSPAPAIGKKLAGAILEEHGMKYTLFGKTCQKNLQKFPEPVGIHRIDPED